MPPSKSNKKPSNKPKKCQNATAATKQQITSNKGVKSKGGREGYQKRRKWANKNEKTATGAKSERGSQKRWKWNQLKKWKHGGNQVEGGGGDIRTTYMQQLTNK